jgi:hypothetical protein
MTVIGRLDRQVDAMLIEPLKRRHEPGAAETTDANAQVETETGPPHDTPQGHARQAETDEQRDADVTLPVWLL